MVEQPSTGLPGSAFRDGVRRVFHSVMSERSLTVVIAMIALVSLLFAFRPDLDPAFSRLLLQRQRVSAFGTASTFSS